MSVGNIFAGLGLPGRRVEIPDCGRDDLPGFLREYGCLVGVEIGVREGRYSEQLCQAGLKVYGVDPWLPYAEYAESGRDMEADYREAVHRLEPYDCTIIRKTSMEALADFRDGELDFVYIDGNHHFVYMAQDVHYWSAKVRPGGVVSGHDYIVYRTRDPFHINVKAVVDAYVMCARIPKLYILGRKAKIGGEVRDRERSWMWFRP